MARRARFYQGRRRKRRRVEVEYGLVELVKLFVNFVKHNCSTIYNFWLSKDLGVVLVFTRIEPSENIDINEKKEQEIVDGQKIVEYRVYIKNKGRSAAKNVKPEIRLSGEGEISELAFIEGYDPLYGVGAK